MTKVSCDKNEWKTETKSTKIHFDFIQVNTLWLNVQIFTSVGSCHNILVLQHEQKW